MTPSQYNAMLRQIRQRQQRAIDDYNRKAREYNRKLQQEIDRVNRENRQRVEAANREIDRINRESRQRVQSANQKIGQYNRGVRAHNARVHANRQRLANEISRLKTRNSPTTYVTFRSSSQSVQRAYEIFERRAESGALDVRYNEILDLSEREAANNAALLNALDEQGTVDEPELPIEKSDPEVIQFLKSLTGDILARWEGALFSLNPKNPDAARHFCTSAREIFIQILDRHAADEAVLAADPNCPKVENKPSRKAKIRYLLMKQGLSTEELETFIEQDVSNILELFRTFNDGTHGTAGRFDLLQLRSIKQRVEHGIGFLGKIVVGPTFNTN